MQTIAAGQYGKTLTGANPGIFEGATEREREGGEKRNTKGDGFFDTSSYAEPATIYV